MTQRIATLVLEVGTALGTVPRELVDALVAAVLDDPAVRLALELRDGGAGEFEGRRLLELAGMFTGAVEAPGRANGGRS